MPCRSFEDVGICGLPFSGEVAAKLGAEIELLLGVGVEMREPADGTRAYGGRQCVVVEVEQFRLRCAERRSAACDRRCFPRIIMIVRGRDAITDRIFGQRVKRDQRVFADIIEYGFKSLIEERQELLDALAPNARAHTIVQRIADRAVGLREAATELKHRHFIHQHFADWR